MTQKIWTNAPKPKKRVRPSTVKQHTNELWKEKEVADIHTFKWPEELKEELKIEGFEWRDETSTHFPRLVWKHPVNGYKLWRYVLNTRSNPLEISFSGIEKREAEEFKFPLDTPPADIMRFIYCHYVLGG